MHLPFNSYVTPIFLPFSGTDLQRTYNGFTTDLLLWQKQSKCDFFLELNAKHIHGGKNRMITHCVSKCLGTCICLPNIYTSHTHHIHAFCSYNQTIGYCCSFCKYSRRDDPCICCVCVWQTYTRF